MRFQDDVLQHVLGYVGPKNYIFIASVCRHWKRQHRLTHGRQTITSLRAAASSLPTFLLYEQDTKEDLSDRRSYLLDRKIGENGDLAMIQWLYVRKRLTFSLRLTASAAKGGHLVILKWLRANGCPWDWETCSNAAKGGHLEVLKWARANGCPWDWRTCCLAARVGHLGTLKWARTNGCDWISDTCSSAARGGHLEVLKWARANGCQWSREVCMRHARDGGYAEMERWIQENRY